MILCQLEETLAVQCRSNFMQELIAVLQDKLHGHQSVYEALLDAHLQHLLEQPQAFQLVLRSLPADSARQNTLYSKLVSILEEGSHRKMIAHDPTLIHHVTRELHRLLPSGELTYALELLPCSQLLHRSLHSSKTGRRDCSLPC